MSDVRVIEYEEAGTWTLGFEILERDAHQKAQYIDASGRLVRIHPQRIAHRYAPPVRLSGEPALFLASLETEVRGLREALDLPTLWELFHAQDETPQLETFCELALGRSDLAAQIAVVRAVREEPAYFRMTRDNAFSPRAPEAVHAMLVQKERERQEKERIERFEERMVHAVQHGAPVTPGEVDAKLLDSLRQLALSDGDEPPRACAFVESIARRCGIALAPAWAAAFEILQRTGVFGPLDCPASCALGRPVFLEEALQQAASIAPPANAPGGRLIFTIDDEETLDIDDALEFSPLPDGTVEIQVHITDPGSAISVGSPLDMEARRRATSVYLPTRRIPMLPEIVSEGTLSLVSGAPRHVISYMAVLDAHGGIVRTQVRLQTIVVSHRLSYDAVDAVLAGTASIEPGLDEVLRRLFAAVQNLRRLRLSAGAIELRLPEPKVRVNADGEIHVKPIDTDSPARSLVAECMILANTMAGKLARDQRLPVIYRIQKPPETLAHATSDTSGVMQLVRKLKKGELSCHPGAHYGLGVDVYVQASSPLRRYADFLASHQIRAFLSGQKAPVSADDLMPILGNAEATAEEITRLERRSTRYWLLKAFSRRSSPVEAVVLESRGGRAQVLVEDMALRLGIAMPRTVIPGTRVRFHVAAVDPLRDEIRVERVEIL